MTALETIAVALGMYSKIPVPQVEWNEKNMRYALCAFPIVGVFCGLSWFLISIVPLPEILRGALLCVSPIIITGGIHLDGYADTCDALSSYGDKEKKRQILHDPHCGAFAVIRVCVYFVLYFALCTAFQPNFRAVLCAGFGFVLSRTLSGWSVAALPMASDTGLARTFSDLANKQRVRIILTVFALIMTVLMAVFCGLTGILTAIISVATLYYYWLTAKKQFGGISGDLAGWFLQKCEFWQLAVIVCCQLLGVGI